MDHEDPIAYLHTDSRVTLVRLDAFAESSREEQTAVLAELRRRAGDDSNDTQTSILVAVFGILAAVFVGPKLSAIATPASTPWLVALAVGATVAVVVAITALPLLANAVFRTAGRERADLWLKSYEGELQRRWQIPGREGRRWRRAH